MDALAVDLMDPRSLLLTFGLIGVFVILFAETGLLVGFFLPGDSLLFVTGIAAAGEIAGAGLPLGWLLVGAPVSAVAGSQLGHYWGASLGRRLFDRPESRFYRHENVRRAESFFTRFGVGRALLLARFVGVVRTFINPVAGVLHVPAKTFFAWNVIGALIWTDGLILAGYLIGDAIPDIDTYLLPIVAVIMVVSLIPLVLGLLKGRSAPEPLLTDEEARAAVDLLGSLAETHPDARTAEMARELSGRLSARLGAETVQPS